MMAGGPRIKVLLSGRPPAPIRSRFGEFERWFADGTQGRAVFDPVPLYAGAALPDSSSADGWIVSGSPDSVNDPLPWLPAARRGLAQAVERGYPVLGVCFGHQLLAVATGGSVAPNPQGWELGSAHVNLTAAGRESPLFGRASASLTVYQSHGEVVTALPKAASLLAGNKMGIQAFQIGKMGFGVQFHPEFSPAIAQRYLELRSAQIPGPAVSRRRVSQAASAGQVLINFIDMI